MKDLKLDNYVVTPRYIATDYRDGKITIPERNLWLWLRVCGSPYGIATVSMETLAKETFNKPVEKNYINKLLLSLKSKRYIWYLDRAGRRGSFDVHMGDWILPTKQIKRLEHYFDDDEVRDEDGLGKVGVTEVGTEVGNLNQRLQTENTTVVQSNSLKSIRDVVRGYDNDKEKDKNNDTNSIASLSFKKRDYRVSAFLPQTYEEEKLRDLAKKLGDEEVSYYIGIYRKHGFEPLNKALEEFKKSDGYSKDNPPAFFNSLVTHQLSLQ